EKPFRTKIIFHAITAIFAENDYTGSRPCKNVRHKNPHYDNTTCRARRQKNPRTGTFCTPARG
ncbi:MAG: hypothetical protein J6H20_00545, partial [Pyramidobacter sp.]|nr:hypothetical protein [Pyramidobacter sp.]